MLKKQTLLEFYHIETVRARGTVLIIKHQSCDHGCYGKPNNLEANNGIVDLQHCIKDVSDLVKYVVSCYTL